MAPRKFWNDGQEILNTDLSQASSALELELYDRVLYELMNRQQNTVFGDSFLCTYVNSTTSKVKAGNGVQYDNTQVDPEPMTRILRVATDTNVTHTAADGSHNRIDIVSIKADRAYTASATRNQKDAISGDVTAETLNIESDWASDLLVTAGTPAVSPAQPSTPAGYILLAAVLVTASSGIGGSSAYTDSRPRFKKGQSWGPIKSITHSDTPYTMDYDDETIVVDASSGVVTVNLQPAAYCSGKRVIVVKSDSSSNAVTLAGNASENISGSNTQAIPNQYGALTIRCDGSQWFIIG